MKESHKQIGVAGILVGALLYLNSLNQPPNMARVVGGTGGGEIGGGVSSGSFPTGSPLSPSLPFSSLMGEPTESCGVLPIFPESWRQTAPTKKQEISIPESLRKVTGISPYSGGTTVSFYGYDASGKVTAKKQARESQTVRFGTGVSRKTEIDIPSGVSTQIVDISRTKKSSRRTSAPFASMFQVGSKIIQKQAQTQGTSTAPKKKTYFGGGFGG